jgi:hypothetical protein
MTFRPYNFVPAIERRNNNMIRLQAFFHAKDKNKNPRLNIPANAT